MIKKILQILVLSCVATSAFARVQEGKVASIFIRSGDGLVYFFLDTAPTAKPACAGANYFMIKDENSAAGKRQLALLMMARATGQTITVIGTGTCTRWPDGEDAEVLSI
jgi:hypothetical protein